MTLALAGDALRVLDALTHFSCKLRPKKIFPALGGAGAPTAPPGHGVHHAPGYAYGHSLQLADGHEYWLPDANKMHQNLVFPGTKFQNFLGRGHSHSLHTTAS